MWTASRAMSLGKLVQTEVVRGLLTPFGHGLWTAIAGAVLVTAAGWGLNRALGVHSD